MQQQFSGTPWLVVEAAGCVILRNVGIEQVKLSALIAGEGLADRSLASAQRFDLGAVQHDAGFDGIVDLIIVARLAILRREFHRRGGSGHDPLGRNQAAAASRAWPKARFTRSLLVSAISARGIRVSAEQKPSKFAAYFTGPGLVSQNSA